MQLAFLLDFVSISISRENSEIQGGGSKMTALIAFYSMQNNFALH